MRAYLIATLIAVVLIMSTTSTSLWEKLADYRLGAKLAQTYGAYVWAELLLLAALTALLLTNRAVPPGGKEA